MQHQVLSWFWFDLNECKAHIIREIYNLNGLMWWVCVCVCVYVHVSRGCRETQGDSESCCGLKKCVRLVTLRLWLSSWERELKLPSVQLEEKQKGRIKQIYTEMKQRRQEWMTGLFMWQSIITLRCHLDWYKVWNSWKIEAPFFNITSSKSCLDLFNASVENIHRSE